MPIGCYVAEYENSEVFYGEYPENIDEYADCRVTIAWWNSEPDE